MDMQIELAALYRRLQAKKTYGQSLLAFLDSRQREAAKVKQQTQGGKAMRR